MWGGGGDNNRDQSKNTATTDREETGRERKSVVAGTLPAHIPVGGGGLLAVDGGEVLERALGVGLHRLAALGPVGGADLAVLVLKVEVSFTEADAR